ncbi:MAG: shikimate kinase [Gemmatimonadales bacterium]
MIERIVLIGFMCAGKSTVGRLLTDRLGWELVDFDETIERLQGQTVADIFRDHGESHFRRLEAELTGQMEARRSVVLVPGGGWVTQHGLVERLRPASLFVWLRVRPDTVYDRYSRLAPEDRPLLAVDDPRGAIQRLLAAREPFYRQADVTIDTDDRPADEVAGGIIDLLRTRRPTGEVDAQC